jgi:hypothetical protein
MSSRHTPRVNIGRDDVRPPKKANRIFLRGCNVLCEIGQKISSGCAVKRRSRSFHRSSRLMMLKTNRAGELTCPAAAHYTQIEIGRKSARGTILEHAAVQMSSGLGKLFCPTCAARFCVLVAANVVRNKFYLPENLHSRCGERCSPQIPFARIRVKEPPQSAQMHSYFIDSILPG